MTDSTASKISRPATEAADWYARLRAEDSSEIEAARFRAWLARDPANRKEFESLDAFWNELSAIERSPEVVRERAAFAAERARIGRRRHRGRERPYGGWLRVTTFAAALSIAVGTFAWLQAGSRDRYVTGIGEQRVIPLADGSVVTLNTSTEVRLHYSSKVRRVDLVTGQANFEVAKDSQRPFIVTAGGGAVRAVGTVFDVYKSAGNVTVTLIEGKVSVTLQDMQQASGLLPTPERPATVAADSAGDISSDQPVRRRRGIPSEITLTAGQQLSYAPGLGSVKQTAADLPRVSAWRSRKLDFNDTPLADAIAEANRYSRLQIELDAPELRDAKISGVFEAGRNEVFAEGLLAYFNLRVARRADDHIVLSTPR